MRIHLQREVALSCPACAGAVALLPSRTVASGTIAWEGALRCENCHREYPVRRGVAYLTVVDRDWVSTLRESVARRRIVQRGLAGQTLEPDREALLEEQNETVRDLMTTLFGVALARVAPRPGMTILDVGAGTCPTSARFAEAGATVVACETEPAHLLAASFAGITPESRETARVEGQFFESRSEEEYPAYFERIVAPVHRLPFPNATFDVVFCRSVLHHLHDLPRALREIMRVLKPGGRFIACSEPVRSALDDENDYLVANVDKEEGLNEQIPALAEYTRPLGPLAKPVEVQVWPNPHRFRTRRLLGFIPYNLHRHMPPGELVTGWRVVKAFPFSASVNVYAVRGTRRVPPVPPSRDLTAKFSAADLAQWTAFDSLDDALAHHDDATEAFARTARALAAACAPPPATFVPALARERDLRIGWRRIVNTPHGPVRHTNRTALVHLGCPKFASAIEVCAAAPLAGDLDAPPLSGSILVNGQELDRFEVNAPQPTTLRFEFEPAHLPCADIEIALDATTRSPAEGEPADLGLAVYWMRLH